MILKNNEQIPFFSIITICYNAEEFIEETIKSVVAQKDSNFEYIIIDGGSKDGTLDIIEKYKEFFTIVVSEPDRGISDAFNKGISYAKGAYINLMNAGDSFLHDYVLRDIKNYLKADIVSFRSFYKNKSKFSYPVDIYSRYESRALLPHQSTFVSKAVYNKFGVYSESFKIRMDYDFFLRVLPHVTLNYVDKFIVLYDAGLSGSLKYARKSKIEEIMSEYLNLKKSRYLNIRLSIAPYLFISKLILINVLDKVLPFLRKKEKHQFETFEKRYKIYGD